MGIAAATNAVSVTATHTRPEQENAGLARLWPSLIAAWTRRLDRRIEDDLRWLDHAGVLDDFRRATHG
jgi:hypothetical protein